MELNAPLSTVRIHSLVNNTVSYTFSRFHGGQNVAYGVRHFNTVLKFFGVQAHPYLERITILKFRSQPTFQWQMLLLRDMRLSVH